VATVAPAVAAHSSPGDACHGAPFTALRATVGDLPVDGRQFLASACSGVTRDDHQCDGRAGDPDDGPRTPCCRGAPEPDAVATPPRAVVATIRGHVLTPRPVGDARPGISNRSRPLPRCARALRDALYCWFARRAGFGVVDDQFLPGAPHQSCCSAPRRRTRRAVEPGIIPVNQWRADHVEVGTPQSPSPPSPASPVSPSGTRSASAGRSTPGAARQQAAGRRSARDRADALADPGARRRGSAVRNPAGSPSVDDARTPRRGRPRRC
jgi:hypothetical protein